MTFKLGLEGDELSDWKQREEIPGRGMRDARGILIMVCH